MGKFKCNLILLIVLITTSLIGGCSLKPYLDYQEKEIEWITKWIHKSKYHKQETLLQHKGLEIKGYYSIDSNKKNIYVKLFSFSPLKKKTILPDGKLLSIGSDKSEVLLIKIRVKQETVNSFILESDSMTFYEYVFQRWIHAVLDIQDIKIKKGVDNNIVLTTHLLGKAFENSFEVEKVELAVNNIVLQKQSLVQLKEDLHPFIKKSLSIKHPSFWGQ